MNMASGAEPPDKYLDKFYKCPKTQRVATVVCLYCENVYHVSEFKQINGARYITDIFVKCPEHPHIELTSKNDHVLLNEDVRDIIGQIKMIRKSQIKKEILEKIEGKFEKNDDHNKTFY